MCGNNLSVNHSIPGAPSHFILIKSRAKWAHAPCFRLDVVDRRLGVDRVAEDKVMREGGSVLRRREGKKEKVCDKEENTKCFCF